MCFLKVLSDSVSKAIQLSGGISFETAYFIVKFDKFFNCFNVSSYLASKRNRKPFLQPYRDPNDLQLNVIFVSLTIVFMFLYTIFKKLLMYLDHWKKSVDDRKDCDPEEKKQIVLSSITEQGIRITA